MPFDTRLHDAHLNPFDSVMTNAQTLRGFGGGGTNCALPLERLNRENAKAENVIYISDNESWHRYGGRGGTAIEWTKFHQRNPKSRLVNIDITPNSTTQIPEAQDAVLNIGGFSDAVFVMLDTFLGRESSENFVKTIENYSEID